MVGKFITFEGVDGSGKTSNIDVVVNTLITAGYKVIKTREPGGTPVAEKIRNILLNDYMSSMAELLLFNAARADHIYNHIRPHLEDGYVVISDRFSDSSYAYQGAGRGQRGKVCELEQFVHHGFEPDYTLFFDITFEESQKRLLGRGNLDRLDAETIAFKKDVFVGYHERFEQNPHRMVKINAMQTLREVQAEVSSWVKEVFIPNNPL